jgi:hypothetical protein
LLTSRQQIGCTAGEDLDVIATQVPVAVLRQLRAVVAHLVTLASRRGLGKEIKVQMTFDVNSIDHFAPKMGDDPYWADSSWFSWAIPDRNITGFFYNHFRPNMNCLLGGPAMWDLSGQHSWEFPYYDWQLMRTLPEGRYGVDYDKYHWTAPWSMSIELLEPLKRYKLGYNRHGFVLDLEFEATAEPSFIGADAADGLEHAFSMHFEQPGRIKGTVSVDGERYAVDTFSIRDGSYGRRFLEDFTPGGYTWSTANEKTGWHLIAQDSENSRETKIWGGYLLRDGTLSKLVRGVRRVVERAGPRPVRLEIDAEDALGRHLHAVGREQVPAELTLFPDRSQWWTLYQWDYDGFTDAVGEDQEYYPLHAFRRWHRAGPKAWALR